MKARVDAGTDVAMIGAWDASRNDDPVPKAWGQQWDRSLQDDAIRGHLFFIHTGADGGGPVDVYVDGEIPPEELTHTQAIQGEFLISVPTGRLIVGGVEDYRNQKPQITGENSIVRMPSGDYLLQCFVSKEETGGDGPTAAELEKAVGVDDHHYFRRVHNAGCMGYLTLLPALAFPFGWKIALPITLIVVLGYFYGYDRILKRNARYQRILKIENELFRRVQQNERPTFIFKLRRAEEGTSVKGGLVYLPEEFGTGN